MKAAVTPVLLDTVTVQDNGFEVDTVQLVHPPKVEPVAGTAVSATDVPEVKLAAQADATPDVQLMPAGLLVTVPVPAPVSETERVAAAVPPQYAPELALLVTVKVAVP